MLDDIGQDSDEARAKIEAARDAIQACLGCQEVLDERLAALVARLSRIAAEVEWVEDDVARPVPVAEAMARRSNGRPAPLQIARLRAYRQRIRPSTSVRLATFVHYWSSVW